MHHLHWPECMESAVRVNTSTAEAQHYPSFDARKNGECQLGYTSCGR